MTDIVLNGVSINKLKKQRDLIQKDANQFIAKGLRKLEALIREIVNERDEDEDGEMVSTDEVNEGKLLKEATELAENISIVSKVSGVGFYIPWCGESCDEEAFSSMLEEVELYDTDLYSILESMESASRDWNESRC